MTSVVTQQKNTSLIARPSKKDEVKVTPLSTMLGLDNVLVVDSSMRPVEVVHWSRAMTLIVSGAAYALLDREDGQVVRSQFNTFPKPLVVALNVFVTRRVSKADPDKIVSRRVILTRDEWTCAYCGEFGDTIDHIMPRSRGGQNTWDNLCCACFSCNSKKMDRTPSEADMRTPVIPRFRVGGGRLARLETSLNAELVKAVQS